VSRRTATRGEVGWRFAGESTWRDDLVNAGPGQCEFAWLDGTTKHVRDRTSALVLPAEFALSQRINAAHAKILLEGWTGDAVLSDETPIADHRWRVRIDPPRRALLGLRLTPRHGSTFDLNVPLRSKEWLATWDGELLRRDTVVGLADLRDTVARAPGHAMLMGEVAHHAGASLEASWKVDVELGLSALRNDIAALMRPLGIDARSGSTFTTAAMTTGTSRNSAILLSGNLREGCVRKRPLSARMSALAAAFLVLPRKRWISVRLTDCLAASEGN